MMVFETEEECEQWLGTADLTCHNMKVIAIMELSEIYQDVHQAIEKLHGYSSHSKSDWLKIYDKYCMTY
jgi:hypothetical protein